MDTGNATDISNYIRRILDAKCLTVKELAEKTNQSRQNLTNKLTRNNFGTLELEAIASAVGCTLKIQFIDSQTGQPVA